MKHIFISKDPTAKNFGSQAGVKLLYRLCRRKSFVENKGLLILDNSIIMTGIIRNIKNSFSLNAAIILFLMLAISSCYSAKTDKIISRYYNNQLPNPDKKKKNDISVLNGLSKNTSVISVTTHKTSHFLPLIIYWQDEFRRTTTLNSQIPATYITNAISSFSNKKLSDKLNGKKLELTIEQTPYTFSTVDKEHMILFLVAWYKIYREADTNSLVVSYKLLKDDSVEKTGRVNVTNNFTNKGIKYFQSLNSAINEYLGEYEVNLKIMAKELMNKLTEEL
jgi:hypothetical protein